MVISTLMPNEIASIKADELEHTIDEIFSAYTHPRLEDFIQNVIDANKSCLPTKACQKLVREFFLYGFLRASGQEFLSWGDRRKMIHPETGYGQFCTNNGILALSDFDTEVYIRGGDSYSGYSLYDNVSQEPLGVEGTLLSLGYGSGHVYVPHSNGDVFADEKREGLFRALYYFSREVRNLRKESTSELIIGDFSEPMLSAPYKRRDPKLPRIVLEDTILIPGNKERTIEICKR